MTLPPLDAGAVKAIVACPLPGVAAPITGAPGTPPTIPKLTDAVAERYVAFPAWVAVMLQVPNAIMVTFDPVTVHTAVVVELNVIGSPDGTADAVSGMTEALNVC